MESPKIMDCKESNQQNKYALGIIILPEPFSTRFLDYGKTKPSCAQGTFKGMCGDSTQLPETNKTTPTRKYTISNSMPIWK